MKKRFFIGGCCLGLLSSLVVPFILILLVIVVAVSLVSPAIALPGPGTSNNTVGQTQNFTGKKNEAVVNAARALVQTLYPCGGRPQHYKCYTQNFPTNALEYLSAACGDPNCPYAQNGNLQCVFFVLAVYYLAGQALPYGPDAIKFWATYQNLPGWSEIPANGAPEPGDIAIFSGPLSGKFANPFGHVAIIIDVAVPGDNGKNGSIQLAQANGLQAVDNLPLERTNADQDHPIWKVTAWPGYTLLGYIRSVNYG
jgi:hypothetical protein